MCSTCYVAAKATENTPNAIRRPNVASATSFLQWFGSVSNVPQRAEVAGLAITDHVGGLCANIAASASCTHSSVPRISEPLFWQRLAAPEFNDGKASPECTRRSSSPTGPG